jgi:hypothetical protein
VLPMMNCYLQISVGCLAEKDTRIWLKQSFLAQIVTI